jgi:hypothetical protein
MKKNIFKFLVLVLALTANSITNDLFAQMNFVFNAMSNGKDLRGLSTLQIINTSTNSYVGTLEITVKNQNNSAVFVKVVLPDLNIASGNNIIPFAKFNSAIISYSNDANGSFTRQTNMMPEGELEYCFKYTITSKNNAGEEYDNCFIGQNLVNTPLELVMPENKDQFCSKRPNFSWQPSLPLNPSISYSIKLVEKLSNQSLAEAILVNNPIVFQNNIKGFSLQYPSNSLELKEDKKYAWQVTSFNKGIQTVSDVWEFTIHCDMEKKDTMQNSFRELQSYDDGSFLSTGVQLRFAFYNAYISKKLEYKIVGLTNPKQKIKGLPTIIAEQGINNITLDLRKAIGMEDGNEYLLKATLPDGKEVSLRFKYTEDE